MATAKKTTTKKTTNPAKKPVATTKKTSVVTKKPVKKTASKKAAAKDTTKPKSFRISHNEPSFKTFKITRQTLYWVILVAFIIFVQLWILGLQIQTSTYIQEEVNSAHSN